MKRIITWRERQKERKKTEPNKWSVGKTWVVSETQPYVRCLFMFNTDLSLVYLMFIRQTFFPCAFNLICNPIYKRFNLLCLPASRLLLSFRNVAACLSINSETFGLIQIHMAWRIKNWFVKTRSITGEQQAHFRQLTNHFLIQLTIIKKHNNNNTYHSK